MRDDFETARSLLGHTLDGLPESTYNRAITALRLAECDRMLGASKQALDLLDSIEDVPEDLQFEFEQAAPTR